MPPWFDPNAVTLESRELGLHETYHKGDNGEMKKKLLICRCAKAEMLDTEAINTIVKKNENAWIVDDLCALAGERDAQLSEYADGDQIVVVACYERAVNWLLKSSGLDAQTEVLNMHVLSTDDVFERLSGVDFQKIDMQKTDVQGIELQEQPSRQGVEWPGWFPVIDYDRCSDCNQCANFCLFGVFETSADERVRVANPTNCKNNCPACARVCPDAAIIFPKLDESPINGDEVGVNSGGPTQVNVHQIMGQDLYQTLKGRRTSLKRRLLRKDALEKAKAERCACMCGDQKPCETTMATSYGKPTE